jgi:hypothetical protein
MYARHISCVIFLSAGLAACTSMPEFDAPESKDGHPTVSHVIKKIECELAEARDARENTDTKFIYYLNHTLNLADFSQWVASVTLSLTISDTGGLSPTGGLALSYIEPLKVAGTSFTFGGNALLYQQRQRIFTQTYTVMIKSLSRQACAYFNGKAPDINLAGDLGLKDQIYMGLHAFHRDASSDYSTTGDPGNNGSPDTFGATASFDVFKGITNLGPNWTLVHFSGPNGGVGYQRDDLDKVAITFAPVAYQAPQKGMTPEVVAGFGRQSSAVAAISVARDANKALVETQAIQQLGQVLATQASR